MKIAQSLMAVNVVVGGLIALLANIFPMVLAVHVPDAVLTPAELHDPVIMGAVSRAVMYYGSRQISLPITALGLLICGLNVWGIMRLKENSTRPSSEH